MHHSGISEIVKEIDVRARRTVDGSVEPGCIVLFSGGIDSSILVNLVKKNPKSGTPKLCTAGLVGSPDLMADFANNPSEQIRISANSVPEAAPEVLQIVEPSTLASFEDCLAFHLIFKSLLLQKEDLFSKVVLVGNGPDELFCGYDRFRRVFEFGGYQAVNSEINNALKTAYKLAEDIERIASRHGLELRQPFLEQQFVEYCKNSIPPNLKLFGADDMLRKQIWRGYGRYLGLPADIVLRSKKAMQYSMGIHKAVYNLMKSGSLTLPSFVMEKSPTLIKR